MAASVISISSDSSDESIYSEVLVVPEVAAATVASPAGVLELDIHSSSESDPSESSLPPVLVAPMVSPFLHSDDSESDIELPERHVSFSSHDAMVARWRSRVASRSSSPTTSTSEIPTAPIPLAPDTEIISPIVAPPEVCRRRAILIRPGQDILVDRLYRTHPGGPYRSSSDHSSFDHSSSNHSSSEHSTSDHSSSGHSTSDHSSSGHTPSVTTIADSSAPLRFVYPPLAKTSRFSEAYRHWRSAPLSTMYLLTTSESSVGDSSSESSARPSRKRCRSPAATVISPIPTLGALVPTRANLLPPRKRFRDSISLKDSIEEEINADVLADIEADIAAVEAAAGWDIEAGIDAGIGIEVEVDPRAGPVVDDDMLHQIQVIESVQRFQGHRIVGVNLEVTTIIERISALEKDNARIQGTLRRGSARADRVQRRMSRVKSELNRFVGFVTMIGRILKNLLDRVLQLYQPFSLPERLKADNTARVNQ
ncbi:hypothetical protein Tco_1253771 [Tanacetum coccineum]